MKRIALGALTAALASAPALAATYNDPTLFFADPDTAGSVFEDFEGATFDGTTITFSGGTISCDGTTYCPPAPSAGFTFFGLVAPDDDSALSGVNAPYIASPDAILFSFTSPLTAFGIFIGGAGDLTSGTTTLTASLGNGEMFDIVTDYAMPQDDTFPTFTGNTLFFGVTSETAFSTVSITGSLFGDGLSFDNLYFRAAGGPGNGGGGGEDPEVIPLPASGLLLLGGLAGIAVLRRRRRG
jgi:hypothetical protein